MRGLESIETLEDLDEKDSCQENIEIHPVSFKPYNKKSSHSRRSKVRLIAMSLPIVFLITFLAACTLTQTVTAQTYPRCQSGCTANDVDITKLWFVSNTGCTQGSYTGQLYATFAINRQNTYCVYSAVDVYVNDQPYVLNLVTKVGDFAESGTVDLPIASVTWPCNSIVTVKNIYIQYATNNHCNYNCGDSGPSKCKIFPGPFIVPPPLIADFSYNGACSSAPIIFADTSSGGDGSIESWSWNFGDGTTFSGQTPPPHTYANSGKYIVTLQITDNQNVLNIPQTITSTISHDITVYGPPTAGFTATATSGCAPLTVTFTNTSNGNGRTITGWSWDFGDSTTYNGQTPPAHIYSSPGTYTVKLTVTTSCGTSTKTNYITAQGSNADFTATPTSGCSPITVTFTNAAQAIGTTITKWDWDFNGDGTIDRTDTSAPSSFAYTYNIPGTYTAKLTTTTSCGTNTMTKTAYITAYGPPSANFIATPTSGCPPLTVTFSNTSNGNGRTITGWSWDFGDSTTYNGQTPPAHKYSDPRTYTVKLTVTSTCGTDTKAEYVTVSKPVVVPGTYGPACVSGGNITLGGSPGGGTWFGDGVSGNIFNPAAAGPGNHVLTYEYTSGSSCSFSNTTTLTVVPLPQTTITVG